LHLGFDPDGVARLWMLAGLSPGAALIRFGGGRAVAVDVDRRLGLHGGWLV
jgi:hypothetical protein